MLRRISAGKPKMPCQGEASLCGSREAGRVTCAVTVYVFMVQDPPLAVSVQLPCPPSARGCVGVSIKYKAVLLHFHSSRRASSLSKTAFQKDSTRDAKGCPGPVAGDQFGLVRVRRQSACKAMASGQLSSHRRLSHWDTYSAVQCRHVQTLHSEPGCRGQGSDSSVRRPVRGERERESADCFIHKSSP